MLGRDLFQRNRKFNYSMRPGQDYLQQAQGMVGGLSASLRPGYQRSMLSQGFSDANRQFQGREKQIGNRYANVGMLNSGAYQNSVQAANRDRLAEINRSARDTNARIGEMENRNRFQQASMMSSLAGQQADHAARMMGLRLQGEQLDDSAWRYGNDYNAAEASRRANEQYRSDNFLYQKERDAYNDNLQNERYEDSQDASDWEKEQYLKEQEYQNMLRKLSFSYQFGPSWQNIIKRMIYGQSSPTI